MANLLGCTRSTKRPPWQTLTSSHISEVWSVILQETPLQVCHSHPPTTKKPSVRWKKFWEQQIIAWHILLNLSQVSSPSNTSALRHLYDQVEAHILGHCSRNIIMVTRIYSCGLWLWSVKLRILSVTRLQDGCMHSHDLASSYFMFFYWFLRSCIGNLFFSLLCVCSM